MKYYNLARLNEQLGGGFEYFLFSPLPGEMIQFDEHIFQMGWFNHHLDKFPIPKNPDMSYLRIRDFPYNPILGMGLRPSILF